MLPFEFSYRSKNQDGTPRHVADFDLPYAYHALGAEQRRGDRSIWQTRKWVNFFLGGVASVIGYGLWFAYRNDFFLAEASLLGKVFFGSFGLAMFAAFLILSLHALTRGTLVLDRRTRELTYYRFWFSLRPHRRLSLDVIRTLKRREVVSPGDHDNPGHTYDILVAELHDDRIASIAIDSPLSVEIEIQEAAGLAESEGCKLRRRDHERVEHRRRTLNRLRRP